MIKLRILRWKCYSELHRALNKITLVFLRRGTHIEDNGKMEQREIENADLENGSGMANKTQECQQPLKKTKMDREKDQIVPQSFWREHGLANTWILAQDTDF